MRRISDRLRRLLWAAGWYRLCYCYLFAWGVIPNGVAAQQVLHGSTDASIQLYGWPPRHCRYWGACTAVRFKVEVYGPLFERGTGYGLTLGQAARRALRNLRRSSVRDCTAAQRMTAARERRQRQRT